MMALILAGGQGTRIADLSRGLPKILLPVANRAFLDWQLECLLAIGVTRFRYCLGLHADQVIRHLAGTDVEIRVDGEQPLGTGGAIAKAAAGLTEPFAVVYGDVLPFGADPQEMLSILHNTGADGCMAVTGSVASHEHPNVTWTSPTNVIYRKENRPTGTHLDHGICVLHPKSLAHAPRQLTWDLSILLSTLSNRGSLAGYPVDDAPSEIGSPDGFRRTESLLLGLAPSGGDDDLG